MANKLEKVIKVIRSCNTIEQLDSAEEYVKLFLKKHPAYTALEGTLYSQKNHIIYKS